MRSLLALAAALALSGCDSARFYSGRFFHETKRWARAVDALEAFVAARPDDPRACEARLRLGQVYGSVFDRPQEARRHYEAAARTFPGDKGCLERAVAGLLSSPDYFPVAPGRTWVYGDSASGGRAMRLEWEARQEVPVSSGTVVLASLFAGNKKLSTSRTIYAKKDWAVLDVTGKKPATVLKYPFAAGVRWTAQGKTYQVEADGLKLSVKAGTFEGCIKVRETMPAARGAWRYDYYCPGVGRVKTTVAAPGLESPNTELLTYRR